MSDSLVKQFAAVLSTNGILTGAAVNYLSLCGAPTRIRTWDFRIRNRFRTVLRITAQQSTTMVMRVRAGFPRLDLLLCVAVCCGHCGAFVARVIRPRRYSFNVRFRPEADSRNAIFGKTRINKRYET